jgi:F-type H+-transporting ATPase subunit epsilon
MVVTVYTAKSKLFDKVQAKSVYVPSISGDMQILNNHIPVIVALRPGMIILEKESGDKIKIKADSGYIQFANNELVAVIEKLSLTETELEELERQAENMRGVEIKHEDDITEEEFAKRVESENH